MGWNSIGMKKFKIEMNWKFATRHKLGKRKPNINRSKLKCVKFKLENLVNLTSLVCCGEYGGAAGDWGEGTWGGVGSFHSQSNSDNDQFSVI